MIYAFKCKTCEHEFEETQAMNDKHEAKCPKCGASAKQVYHPCGIIYKTGGFHTTDYGKSGTKA